MQQHPGDGWGWCPQKMLVCPCEVIVSRDKGQGRRGHLAFAASGSLFSRYGKTPGERQTGEGMSCFTPTSHLQSSKGSPTHKSSKTIHKMLVMCPGATRSENPLSFHQVLQRASGLHAGLGRGVQSQPCQGLGTDPKPTPLFGAYPAKFQSSSFNTTTASQR